MPWFDTYRERRVFITGGSSGIGLALASQLVRHGANVGICGRDRTRLDTALGALRNLARPNQRIVAFPIDVGDNLSVKEAARCVLEALGGIDILINNAGIAHPGRFEDLPEELFEQMMRVNYHGAVNVTRAFLGTIRSQPGGHIAFVSSLLGFMGIYGYSAYAPTKFALVGFAECLRQELLPFHVGVSVVYPPDTDTPQLAAENAIKPKETKAIAANVRALSPEKVAFDALKGMARKKLHIVPGRGGAFTHFMYRHLPSLVRRTIDHDLRKALR